MIRANKQLLSYLMYIVLVASGPEAAMAGEIRVAVASNFADAMSAIAEVFEQKSGHKVHTAVGSTGRHYAQIRNGAPFEVFLAADTKRPKLLEDEGIAVPGSRFTYAVGQLVLWSPIPNVVDARGEVLERRAFRHLAIANPKLAPYGRAAQEVLLKRGLWDEFQRRIVRGENIGQTFQFVASGNAELGFVAASQVVHPEEAFSGSIWQVPEELYSPIDQQAVLLRDEPVARAFHSFLQGEESKAIIRKFGYETP